MYFYGSRCDRRPDKRATLTGRGSVGKAIVAGAVVRRPTLTHPITRNQWVTAPISVQSTRRLTDYWRPAVGVAAHSGNFDIDKPEVTHPSSTRSTRRSWRTGVPRSAVARQRPRSRPSGGRHQRRCRRARGTAHPRSAARGATPKTNFHQLSDTTPLQRRRESRI